MGFVADSTQTSSYKTLKPGEHIYGLGEKNGPLDRVGSRLKMWNSDKPCYSVNEDPLYKSIPFFMSSSGYGIFFDNTYKTTYDFGVESDNYYSFSTPGGEMEYYFIYGPTYKQIISGYTKLTGQPIMPPAWALGFAQCRGMLTNEQLTREIAKDTATGRFRATLSIRTLAGHRICRILSGETEITKIRQKCSPIWSLKALK